MRIIVGIATFLAIVLVSLFLLGGAVGSLELFLICFVAGAIAAFVAVRFVRST